ncbi:GNAT family N-acetyltransferase [Lacticaseibacillus kribbianus]|uniref:GNAT family N-acetyltransferase n=1 Tax=Lacticaseibacillus kribbianus TaxID=2926292 RepID=UPI001CD4B4C0|nr:GNAT family N-acetyltransferase [Lacticaseibacillus kribbianus]
MIRPAVPEDAQQVVPLINLVFEEMEVPELQALPDAALFKVFEQAFLLKDYRYGYPQTFVHEANGRVDGILVGYGHDLEAHIDDAFKPLLAQVGLGPDQELFPDFESYPGEWYVDTLAVAPAAQGHGIGTKLLTDVAALLKRRGVTTLSLNVDQLNPKAEHLYRKVGYTKQGELMIGSHRYNHMTKAL